MSQNICHWAFPRPPPRHDCCVASYEIIKRKQVLSLTRPITNDQFAIILVRFANFPGQFTNVSLVFSMTYYETLNDPTGRT